MIHKLGKICHAHCPDGTGSALDGLAPVIGLIVAAVGISVLLVALWHIIVWGCCLFTGTVIGYRLIVRRRRRERQQIALRSRLGVSRAAYRQMPQEQQQAIDSGLSLHFHTAEAVAEFARQTRGK